MRILGIDPGYAIVGYGAVEYRNNKFVPVEYGAIETPAGRDFPSRLEQIFDEMTALLVRLKPEAMAVEKLFFNSNTTTAIDVAEARGVILLAARKQQVPIFEYTPLQVKQSVTGYGRAEKKQIMEMTRIFLGLEKVPKPDDTADALAMAICHAHAAGSSLGRLNLALQAEPQKRPVPRPRNAASLLKRPEERISPAGPGTAANGARVRRNKQSLRDL